MLARYEKENGMRGLPFPVVCDRLLLVLPADHPLTRWKDRIPLEAFDGERFVLRERATGAGFYKQRSRPLCCRRFTSNTSSGANST